MGKHIDIEQKYDTVLIVLSLLCLAFFHFEILIYIIGYARDVF